MNCPKCGEASLLRHLDLAGIEVDLCATCQGAWFDAFELDDLLELDAETLAPLLVGELKAELNARGGQCPRDGVALSRQFTGGRRLEVDACRECQGVWLDGGEFARIQRGG